MTQSILDGKKILAIDDEPDVLAVLEEEIAYKCPNAKFEKATTYEDAKKLLESQKYDVVVLDIMGVRGFDLLDIAVKRNLKVAMLTAHALTPEALKRSYDMKARAYLPKNKLGEVVPFLEDVLKYDYQSGWKRLFEKLHGFFTEAFESDWKRRQGWTGESGESRALCTKVGVGLCRKAQAFSFRKSLSAPSDIHFKRQRGTQRFDADGWAAPHVPEEGKEKK